MSEIRKAVRPQKRPPSMFASLGGDVAVLHPRGFDRRRRDILATTWDMIAQHGSDQFKLSDLSERCGVALRTIYNAFVDKDNLIAEAVAAHYHSLFDSIAPGASDSRTLEESAAMMARVAFEISRAAAFSGTGARMYFSTRSSSRLLETLRRLPILSLKAWMRSDEADRKQIQQFGRDALERSFANLQWGSVNDWLAGRLDNAELSSELKKQVIWVAMAFGNRAGRAAAKRLSAEIA